jgi:hypothetical protein
MVSKVLNVAGESWAEEWGEETEQHKSGPLCGLFAKLFPCQTFPCQLRLLIIQCFAGLLVEFSRKFALKRGWGACHFLGGVFGS